MKPPYKILIVLPLVLPPAAVNKVLIDYNKVQRDAERSMQEISLQDIIQSFEERVQRNSADDTL